ncbi:MAG: Hsp20/alpha crystallin family protein [Nitrospiraceae bacterium]|nr:Hsp20/alpha crystallin family protein [Nitrospiraceae bacterium]
MTVLVKELARRERPTYLSPFREMEKLFGNALLRPFSLLGTAWPEEIAEFGTARPLVDIYEEGNELIMKADLPGMKKEDVDIHVSDNVLTISGERKTEEKVEKGGYFTYERTEGAFCRRFELPVDVDTAKVTARLENGVLEIRLPKAPEIEAHSKKIEITG